MSGARGCHGRFLEAMRLGPAYEALVVTLALSGERKVLYSRHTIKYPPTASGFNVRYFILAGR